MYYHNFNRGVPFLPTTPSHYDTGASKENFGKCLSHGYYDMALSGFDPTTSVTTSNPIIFQNRLSVPLSTGTAASCL